MITIQTSTSRIVNVDGSAATGYILITPSEEFEFTDSGVRKKVSLDPIKKGFTAGVLDSSFSIAPTLNATHDKTNLYYSAFFSTPQASWTEYWVVDAGGASTLELTSITRVIVDPVASTTDFVNSDDVSSIPLANKIPRALQNGTLDPGWFGGNGAVLAYIASPLPTLTSGVIALGYDVTIDQVMVWTGTQWRTIA